MTPWVWQAMTLVGSFCHRPQAELHGEGNKRAMGMTKWTKWHRWYLQASGLTGGFGYDACWKHVHTYVFVHRLCELETWGSAVIGVLRVTAFIRIRPRCRRPRVHESMQLWLEVKGLGFRVNIL